MVELIETADVARMLGLTPASVRYHAVTGRLRVALRTRRGLRLFRNGDVVAFMRQREGARRTATSRKV